MRSCYTKKRLPLSKNYYRKLKKISLSVVYQGQNLKSDALCMSHKQPCWLMVYSHIVALFITVVSVLLLCIPVPATVNKKFSSANLEPLEGTNVSLICNVSGKPTPSVTWTVHRFDSTGFQRKLFNITQRWFIPTRFICESL